MGRKKLFNKGGATDTIEGPFLEVKLNKTEKNRLLEIKKKYEEKIKNVEFNFNKATEERKLEEKHNIEEKNEKNKNDNLKEKTRYHSLLILGNFLKALGTIIYQLVRFICIVIKEGIEFLFKLGNFVVKFIGVGKGTVLRYVLAILFFLLIFFGIFGIAMAIKNSNTPATRNNIISDTILRGDQSTFLTIKSPTFFSKFSNGLFSMVPDKYKYSFSSMTGSFNYMITGKNQYDEYLEKRETVENDAGRSDNIFNICFKNTTNNLINNKTYSILKPNDIKITLDMTKNPTTDLNRLPDNFNSELYFGLFDNYTLPVYAPSSNWVLDVNNAYFSSNDNSIFKDVRIYANNHNNIFKINEKGLVVYNSFLNKNYYTLNNFQNYNTMIQNNTVYIQIINNLNNNYSINIAILDTYNIIIAALDSTKLYTNPNYINIINNLDKFNKLI
jgi:hypothetical protein